MPRLEALPRAQRLIPDHKIACRAPGSLLERQALAPLVDWKRRKGLSVELVTTDQSGSSREAIQSWLRQAYAAPTPREQGLALARVALLQRERGLDAAAQAAAQEAMKLSHNDPEVRAILGRSLRPDEIRPPR